MFQRKSAQETIAFLSILFSRPEYDRMGEVASLSPAKLTEEVKELLTSCSSTTEQARSLAHSLDALTVEISKERSYLGLPVHEPNRAHLETPSTLPSVIDRQNIDSIKKMFNVLALLAPPSTSNEDHSK